MPNNTIALDTAAAPSDVIATLRGKTEAGEQREFPVGQIAQNLFPFINAATTHGVIADGTTDDSPMLAAAVAEAESAGGGTIILPAGVLRLVSPTKYGSHINFCGAGRGITILKKSGTTTGSGSNSSRAGVITDTYSVNAILIATHDDDTYNYESGLSNLSLVGADDYTTNFGLYAPRTSRLSCSQVDILRCQSGFYTFDSWLSRLEQVMADAESVSIGGVPFLAPAAYGFADSAGFVWANDGSFGPTGTTLNATGCWAKNCNRGWDIYGLKYSTLTACAADNITGNSYLLSSSELSLISCGSESVQLISGALISCSNSTLFASNFGTYNVNGNISGTASIRSFTGGKATFVSASIDDFITPNSALRDVIQSGATVVDVGGIFPTNGNAFVSHSGGSSRTKIGDETSITDATGVHAVATGVRANDYAEATVKSIASGGSVIATFTADAVTGMRAATIKITISHADGSYPSNVGRDEILVSVYKDGVNYRQDISVLGGVFAGNAATASPDYALSRSADVWSLTMTPADGATTVRTIRAETENHGGISLALT